MRVSTNVPMGTSFTGVWRGDMEVLRLEGVSLHFPAYGRDILKEVSWTVRRGERWVLFGRNGAGKSKLLEMAAGYIHPSGGTVARFGEERGDVRDTRRRIGYTSCSLRTAFPRHSGVMDVVLSGYDASIGVYRDFGPEERGEARRLLDAAGMAHLARSLFGTLSDGEKQRVLMLRAAVREPDVLVLDEPAEGLDMAAREDLLETMERLWEINGAAVIYVTHQVQEITGLFTMLLVLHRGECLYRGPVDGGLTGDMLSRIFERPVRVERRQGRYYAYIDGTPVAS
ncbi:MAG: ATP-binding cassette domain-containing protein [Spirochaetes bacterium]|nr:ATP-binding cassette domain-containing protein [Spirochaetota bacterium]